MNSLRQQASQTLMNLEESAGKRTESQGTAWNYTGFVLQTKTPEEVFKSLQVRYQV